MTPLAGRRSIATAVPVAMLCGAAIVFRFPPAQFQFYPRCPIHAAFGILCPGCGSTRALAALLHGQFTEALHWNPLFVALLPCALTFAAISLRRAWQTGPFLWPRLPHPAGYALGGLTLFFFVARNLF